MTMSAGDDGTQGRSANQEADDPRGEQAVTKAPITPLAIALLQGLYAMQAGTGLTVGAATLDGGAPAGGRWLVAQGTGS